MATVNVCDATGQILDSDFETIGGLCERSYTAESAADVKAYLEARDALHDRVASEFSWGLLELREAFRLKYPDGKLPDEL